MKLFRNFFFFTFLICYTLISFSNDLKSSENLLTGTLPNGLTYFIYKNSNPENRATLNLVVKSGSLVETDKEQGIAHFLEHMAFNGTTKYEKNEMIKYLQSIGLSFGGDLNAYTSFGETVYKLDIPSNEKDLKIGIEVLKEWATEVTLAEEAVKSEKNIILEEWRLRQGLSQRLGDSQKAAIFGDSRYSERFPIGLTSTINSATSETLKGYYKKWYQPKNMAVIAVGDFTPETLKMYIEQTFNYEGVPDFKEPQDYAIGNSFKNRIVVFSDPELTSVNINFITREDSYPINSEQNLKNYLISQIMEEILNTRFSLLSKKKDSPVLVGYHYSNNFGNFDNLSFMSTALKEDKINEGIKESIRPLKILATTKISNEELESAKKELLSSIKQIVNNRTSIQNRTFVESIKEFYLSKNTFMEPENELLEVEKLLPSITPEDIQNRASNIYNGEQVIFMTAPTKENLNLPTDNEIKTIISEVKNEKTVDNNLNYNNLKLKTSDYGVGTIKSTVEKKDYTTYTLSNGLQVFYKQTDFDKDKISMQLFKEEGSSDEKFNLYLNSLVAPYLISNSGVGNLNYEEVELFMKGKNFSVNSYIEDYEQGFTITSDKENLSTSLDLMRTIIENPQINTEIFNNTKEKLSEQIKNRENSPKLVYSDKIKGIMSNFNPRRTPLTLSDLDKINEKDSIAVFKNKFSNFKDFKLIVVGSIDKETFEKIITKYFATLPVSNTDVNITPLNIKKPSGIIKETLVKGVDKKATVTIIYPYTLKYDNNNRIMANAFSKILNIILIEEIREKLGGVYSIYSISDFEQFNYGENNLRISFSTDIKRVNEVSIAVKNVVNNLVSGQIDSSKIADVLENYKLDYETSQNKNLFWAQSIYKSSFIKDYSVPTPNEYSSLITEANMIKFLKTLIDKDNYVEVVLLPEKEE